MDEKKQLRENIKTYCTQIRQYASGPNNVRRLNNINWVRFRVTSKEPPILFQMSNDASRIDYTYINNIGTVYDYINQFQDRPTKHQLTVQDITDMHAMFTMNTHMQCVGGIYRNNDKILNIYIDGGRMHTVDASLVPSKMENIVYKANTSKSNILDRAFDLHYEIIELQPFEDCNKRVARAAMNLFLVLNKMPMVFFDSKEDKLGYVDAFSARINGQNKKYTEYMLRTTARSYRSILCNIKHSKIL